MIGDLLDDGAAGGGGASSLERYGIGAEADPAAVRALSRSDVTVGAFTPRASADFGTTLSAVASDFGRAAGSVLEAIPRGIGRAAGAAAGGVASGLGLPSLPILLGGLALLLFFKD